ncbi:MAG: ABC transporter substrate-binding protein [Candidatus Rokubacteria bacterium]|nr:ABC transporter substrate-binding protein [Candidatus Rokubacteria bacterium]
MVAVALGLWALPVADAQPPAPIPRIGLLSPFSPSDAALWHQAFRQGLRDLGWVEGKNISIEYRYAEGRSDRLPGLAAELVRLKVDLIVASTGTDGLVAKNATRAIPIVVASAGDAVGGGLVESLARPGGNITGLSQIAPEMAGKRLELLKEIAPRLSRVAVLWNPEALVSTLTWEEIQRPARQLGVQLHSLEVRTPGDFARAFENATRARAGALLIMPSPVFLTNLKRIADFAAKNHLPSIFHIREFADSGGLMAYGVDRSDMFRRAATYVDKILKGAKPSDLPVEQPTKFELVINLKTAKALGLQIPPSVLVRADTVLR